MTDTLRRWLAATAVAGTLDLASAFVFSAMAGAGSEKVLGFVASGPFGDAMLAGGPVAMAAGVAVHFGLMAIIVAVYVAMASRYPPLSRRPWLAGVAFGLVVWLVMYWVVRPLRWPAMPLPHTFKGIAQQLFSHIILVGIPIAFIVGARRGRGTPLAEDD